MSFARSIFIVLLISSSAAAATIRGIVRDPSGQPLPGATVAVENIRTVVAANDGTFVVEVPQGAYELVVSHPGFRDEHRQVAASTAAEGSGATPVDVTLKAAIAESIVVSGIRAEPETPVTKTDIDRQQIEKEYHQQDVPLLMREAPSIAAYAESGSGYTGYSYITLRGVNSTRINFTLDGVPLADSEDMATYFADFPDLAHSLQSIQIQRGVGTSTVGSASFGGSVNLESIALTQDEQTTARVAGGSYGTKVATVGYQSGYLPGNMAFYTRVSVNDSNGFRQSSGEQQRNIFFSGIKYGESSQLKLTGFSGHEAQHLSFYAADAATLQQNLRANPLNPEERDSFGYDLANLQYLKSLGTAGDLTASMYYQRGYGWYRLYDDSAARTDLRQYGLDGMLMGSLVTYSRTIGGLKANFGVHVNRFRREHTRDLVSGPRDYYNYGTKGEANAFAKATYDTGAWHYYGDAQLRHTDFRYHGDVSIAPVSWTFFNPKVGVRRDLSPATSVYASVGRSTREPARNDMFQGEDNATVPHDLHAVKPERLLDFEGGVEFRAAAVSLKANLYAMEFRNEIASTGELSDIGLLLRRNVDRSYRRGVEIDATWDARPSLRLRTIASLSRNRIGKWTQFYDVYDAAGNWVDSKPVNYYDVAPVLTPSVIVNEVVEYTPSSRFSAGLIGRYVGRSFLDNTDNKGFVTPSFFTADANASLALSQWIPAGNPRLSLQVNNVLNNKRVYGSGYSTLWLDRSATGAESMNGTPYYFPQATRNFMVMVDFKM